MWVMEIKYIEFYCKFYYIYEHFEIKMILWTKYFDNSWPCTEQVKMIQKKRKKVCSRCLKNHFQLYFKQYGIISSRTSTSLLQILENWNLWHTYSTSGMGLLQDPPFYWKKISIDNSVRRLLLLKIVLHSLFAGAIDGLLPNSAYADPFWLICSGSICIKKTFFPFRTG